ncbi:hypothetical protein DQ04_02061090 [Trypanosoma grayi]|uniref:hypothetical protein n=1 Tax=Trypanosoma grayi TaxID=71804 RepID=UPI0004F46843|nr:hypothetical protein DQ04_02061090 [Trypanosoma grayi]KEG12032.1 hypothetical protein DQ04_02061090 [Trypanosoma grayi]
MALWYAPGQPYHANLLGGHRVIRTMPTARPLVQNGIGETFYDRPLRFLVKRLLPLKLNLPAGRAFNSEPCSWQGVALVGGPGVYMRPPLKPQQNPNSFRCRQRQRRRSQQLSSQQSTIFRMREDDPLQRHASQA